MFPNIMTVDNPKTLKSQKHKFYTIGLSLSPADSSGRSVCPPKTCLFCKDMCLDSAGRGRFPKMREARVRRTNLFFDNPQEFWRCIRKDIETAENKTDMTLCVRMNLLSDLPWERIKVSGTRSSIMEMYPDVQFYDYTKVPGRKTPGNYHLTFSLSENNDRHAMEEVWNHKRNLAVVMNRRPRKFYGIPTVDGDSHDLTFLRPWPRILALTPKGKMKGDTTGFVR